MSVNLRPSWCFALLLGLCGLSSLLLFNRAPFAADEEETIVRYPVPAECKKELLNYLKVTTDTPKISYEYVDFNLKLETHQEIVGYVTLRSSTIGYADLSRYSPGPQLACSQDTVASFPRDEDGYWRDVFRYLEFWDARGSTNIYVKVLEDKVEVRMRDASYAEELRANPTNPNRRE